MITIFENFHPDYILIDLHKLDMPLTYSVFNRQGDKEYKITLYKIMTFNVNLMLNNVKKWF